MFSHVHFAVVAVWVTMGIAGLLWLMACAITANKMEHEGVTFWKAFVTCFFLTPLVGLLAIGVSRLMRPNRPLIQTVTRG
jgi:hypothetical protein